MKKLTILYLAAFAACSVVFSSYYTGVATTFGLDCTGAETALNNPMGCDINGACHTHTLHQTWINVDLELDSAGVPTTHYTGGMTYSVKLIGTNTTNDSLPIFGFQVTSIFGDTAAPIPTNAGTWTTPFPFGTHYSPPQTNNFNLGLMEQNPAHSVTTGTGRLGSTYVVAINWTAPVTGSGDVSFWGVVNAVNNDVATTGDNFNFNHLVIRKWQQPVGVSAYQPLARYKLSVFPNPATEYININYLLEKPSMVSLKIVDLMGKEVMVISKGTANAGIQFNAVNVAWLSRGIYYVMLNAEEKQYSEKLVIQ